MATPKPAESIDQRPRSLHDHITAAIEPFVDGASRLQRLELAPCLINVAIELTAHGDRSPFAGKSTCK